MRCLLFDVQATPFGDDRVLIRSPARNASWIVTGAEARILSWCQNPRTLDEHTASITAKLLTRPVEARLRDASSGYPQRLSRTIHARLCRFLDAGMLTGEAQLFEHDGRTTRGKMEDDSRVTITTVGIPTRDRDAVFARALKSYLANDTRYGRATEFVIIDDSHTPNAARRNRASGVEHQRESGRTIRYAAPGDRERHARAIARHAGISEAITRFVLLGDERCRANYGAARNALLLDTVGEPCLQVDDDTVCRLYQPPCVSDGVGLSSEPDPNEYWYFADLEAAVAAGRPADLDLLALHEAVLGRRPAALSPAGPSAFHVHQDLDGDFIGRILQPEARIGVSYAGMLGDCGGIGLPQYRLAVGGGSFARLTEHESRFETALHARTIIRCSPRTTINRLDYCITAVMGIDNRTPLPPFMPVQGGEDTLFGLIRSALHPDSHAAYLPYCVLHDPSSFRPNRSRAQPFPILMNDVVAALAAQLVQSWPPSGRTTLQESLGLYFRELGELSAPVFARHVNQVVTSTLAARYGRLDDLLAKRSTAPGFWKQRVQDFQRELLSLCERGTCASPVDLHGTVAQRQARFQETLVQFGHALVLWDQIVSAAAELRALGKRISVAV